MPTWLWGLALGVVVAVGAADLIISTRRGREPRLAEAALCTAGIVALGALTRDGSGYVGSFTVPSNLPMAQLDLIDVSAERYDGNPGHSGVSILRGTIS